MMVWFLRPPRGARHLHIGDNPAILKEFLASSAAAH
jgi:hypothetical protein